MKKYQSHKVVEAARIADLIGYIALEDAYAVRLEDGEDFHVPNHLWETRFPTDPTKGYLVKYRDGFVSWSPAAEFEAGYEAFGGAPKPPISGYRGLTEEELANINAIKAHSKVIGELVEELRKNETLDQRWVAIGATDLQKGFMSLTRAIAQPEGF